MKYKNDFLKKQLLPIAILLIIANIIWFSGPLIVIGNRIPFQSPEKRFYLITILFLAWLLKISFFDVIPRRSLSEAIHAAQESIRKLRLLKGRFSGAIQFLKKTVINKHGINISLSYLPWYLFIGPSGAGKTTLLANSQINFILSKQFKDKNLKEITPSDCCDWWVTRDLVLIDTPGAYLIPKEKNSHRQLKRSSLHNILWINLINLIKKNRPKKNPLNGVVIALHLPELIKQQQTEKNSSLYHIKERIIELREKFGNQLPFYLVITKCDLLPGFLEFFGDSGSDELTQPWGITLPALKDNEKIIDVFSNRFNALIKRLNKQLIWRLHQERDSKSRPFIKDFPLQMERLKETLSQFLKSLNISNLHLQSVYLTSALQQSVEISSSSTDNRQLTQHQFQAIHQLNIPIRSYFIRQLILQAILPANDQQIIHANAKNIWHNRIAYTAAISTIVTAAFLLGRDFLQSVQQTYALQSNLTQYQLYMQQPAQSDNHLIKAAPLLTALHEAATHRAYRLSPLNGLLSFYSNKSQDTANQLYQNALQAIVIPEIKNLFEKYLQSPTDKNPVHLYAVLKAYLMLGNLSNFQEDFVENTLKELTSEQMNKDTTEQLNQHIHTAFHAFHQPLSLNKDLIAEVRAKFKNLSSLELSYIILKNMGDNSSDNILSLGTNPENPSVFVSKEVTNQIPNMFTANNFSPILSKEISIAAQEASRGNWVIGNTITTSSNANLTDELRAKYISNYVDVWESLLANIQLVSPKDLTQTDNMLATLTGDKSPLLQLLQTIQQNTHLTEILSASPKLQTLNTLLSDANNQSNALYHIFISLRQLHFYLHEILSASDSHQVLLQATAAHMQNSNAQQKDPLSEIQSVAESSSEPMKTWLTKLVGETWNLMMQDTSHYIENYWQTNVISIYQTQIANRFPFATKATQEINLQQFINFLGTQGTLSNFYQNFLKPFIIESEKNWKWKTFNNQKLPFSDDVLEQLYYALKVQRAFFPNGDNQLFVQFSLQPIAVDNEMKNFTLNINGQQLTYQKNNPLTQRVFIWPGANSMHAAAVNFIAPNNQLMSNVIHGDWGWFKLVNQSTKDIRTHKELVLSFEVNGHKAKYLLATESHMNPFLPLNLQNFRLPERLSEQKG